MAFRIPAYQRWVNGGRAPASRATERKINFRRLLDAANEAAFRIRLPEGVVEYVSPAAEIVFGHSIEKIRGHPRFLDWCIAPEFMSAFEAHRTGWLSGQVETRSEFKVIDAQGVERWIVQLALPVHDPAGRLVAVEGLWRDESELHATREALREARNRMALAGRVADIGTWKIDFSVNRLTWSDEVLRIFEVSPSPLEVGYEALLAIVHPQDQDAVVAAFRTAIEDRVPFEIEHRLLFRDGRIKWVRGYGEPVHGHGERGLALHGTIQDVTERKRIDQARHESEATLAAFLHVSPEAIIVTDADARIKVFSAGAEAVFGYAADEVLGREVGCL